MTGMGHVPFFVRIPQLKTKIEKLIMLKYNKKNKLKSQIANHLLQFDLFGQCPNFRVLKQQKFTTPVGACFTVILIITTVTFMIFQIDQLLTKTTPSVVQSDEQVVDSNPIYLAYDNFTLAVSIANLQMENMANMNKYFTISIQNCERHRDVNSLSGNVSVSLTCVTYPTEPCTLQHFSTEIQYQHFSKIPLANVHCLQKEFLDNRPLQLQGTTAGITFKYLLVEVSECRNNTARQTCAPREEIQKALRSAFYAVHVSDNLLKMDSSGMPFQPFIGLHAIGLSISSSRQIFDTYRISKTKTDSGIVFNSFEEHQSISRAQYRDTQENYNELYMIQHYLVLDNRSTTYYRAYIKLQGIFSSVGGLWQLMFLLMSFVVSPIVKTMMNVRIANKLYRFECGLSYAQRNTSVITSQSSPIRCQDDLRQIRDSKLIKHLLKQSNFQLPTELRKVVFMIFGCDRKNKRLLQYANHQFMAKLNITTLVKKLYELERLKLVLLNKAQYQLFACIPKPLISSALFQRDYGEKIIEMLEVNNDFKQILADEMPSYIKIQQAYDAFSQLQGNSVNLSDTDKALLSFMDRDISSMFLQISMNKDLVPPMCLESPKNENFELKSHSQKEQQDSELNIT